MDAVEEMYRKATKMQSRKGLASRILEDTQTEKNVVNMESEEQAPPWAGRAELAYPNVQVNYAQLGPPVPISK